MCTSPTMSTSSQTGGCVLNNPIWTVTSNLTTLKTKDTNEKIEQNKGFKWE